MSLYTYDSTIVTGKVGRDAEMKYMPSGDPVTSFSVAVDRSFKKDGTEVKRTIWYRVSVFGKFAEVCQNIKKGDNVLCVGNLEADWATGAPRIWNKQDGSAGSSFELTAQTVRFLSRKNDAPAQDSDESPF